MIIGLHHAQITIPKGKEEEGKQFYCNVLGLREIEKPASLQGRGGFWLQVGEKKFMSEQKLVLTGYQQKLI